MKNLSLVSTLVLALSPLSAFATVYDCQVELSNGVVMTGSVDTNNTNSIIATKDAGLGVMIFCGAVSGDGDQAAHMIACGIQSGTAKASPLKMVVRNGMKSLDAAGWISFGFSDDKSELVGTLYGPNNSDLAVSAGCVIHR